MGIYSKNRFMGGGSKLFELSVYFGLMSKLRFQENLC